MMKAILLLFGLAAAAAAQSTSGYVFFGPGGVTTHGYTSGTLHMGAGGDINIYKGVGANLELGALGPWSDFGNAVGLFSAGGVFQVPRPKEAKVQPFVAGGYSLMFRSGHANLGYFGGGMNYWFAKRIGLRADFRDHMTGQPVHFWGFRFGIAFR